MSDPQDLHDDDQATRHGAPPDALLEASTPDTRAATTSRAPAPLLPGDVIAGRYRVEDTLGTGGFAHVFLAHDDVLHRDVAVKVLHITHTLPEAHRERLLARFEREARVAAGLRHPAIVQIHDMGVLDAGHPFIVMERLVGHDLADHIQTYGAADPASFLPEFTRCLRGLGAAHQRGIVHKDLKPSNIFWCDPDEAHGQLRLVDFGIAHVHTKIKDGPASGRLTRTGELLGTPRYMAPEYIEGDEATPAVDVYQMALVLIEALTGEFLFMGQNMAQSMMMHLRGELELPERVMSSPIGPVLRRALSRDPGLRYQDGDAFADALDALDLSALPATFEDPDDHDAEPPTVATAPPEHTVLRDDHTVVTDPPSLDALPGAHEAGRPWDAIGYKPSPDVPDMPAPPQQATAIVSAPTTLAAHHDEDTLPLPKAIGMILIALSVMGFFGLIAAAMLSGLLSG